MERVPHRATRVFLRLKKATEHGAGKGWFDHIVNEQRNDELLGYLLHARDAAEHGIDQITEKRAGSVGIRSKGNCLHVKELRLQSSPHGLQVTGDPETLKQLVVEFIPGTVHLIAVVDRGVVYQPPKNHLGKAIENPNPIAAAELAIVYLEMKLAEAEAYYVK